MMTKRGRHNKSLHYFRIKKTQSQIPFVQISAENHNSMVDLIVVNDFENVTILSPHSKLFKSCKFSERIKSKNYKNQPKS